MSCFLLNLAELEYHRQFWKKSEENLNEAIEYQNKVDNHIYKYFINLSMQNL